MKILHLIPALKFFRVYQSFKEYPGLEQMIIGPTEVAEPRFHYGYADFGIKNVRTFINRNHKQKNKLKECQEIQKYIDDFCPDVVTQTRLKNKGIVLPPQAKRVFVNHGMVGDDIARFLLGEEPPNKHAYSEFDLCCGATEIYRNYLTNDFSVDPGKIVLNALPQLDLLSNPDYYNSKKSLFVPSVLAKKPIILYFGHIGIEETIGIRPHRREFFDTLFELAEVVNKIDGILFVKPRANYVDLREMSAAEKLLKTHYKPIWKNPRVKFINTQYPIYQYMFADIVVCNGYSTTEVEAVIAGKPVVKVNLITKPLIKDYYKTLEEGAAIEVTAIKDILPAINTILKSGQMRNTLEEGRNRFISKHNILLDGKANERILDRIIKLSDTTQDVPPQVYVKKLNTNNMEAKMRETQQKLWASQSDAVVKEYWDFSGEVGLRTDWFVKQLHDYDFSSIYEVGMFSGRNLYKIQNEFPDVKVGGCDINDEAIRFAKDKLPNAEILYESIYDLDESKKWDIVFTMGVLIHIPQDGFELAINKMIAKANNYVIHIERTGSGVTINGPKELNPVKKIRDKFMWYPNLEKAYNNLGLNVTQIALPKSVSSGELTLVVVKL